MTQRSYKPHCLTALNRLEPYMDRELSESEMIDVRHHLDDCPPCAEYFHLQEQVKMLVRRKGCPETAPPELLHRILQSLHRPD
jgi:mycothiol system anti-sigma-R factor